MRHHDDVAENERQTERGLDRFVNFSDAVVAIAITLLILPAVDAVNDRSVSTAGDFFRDNGDRLFAFALSFVVIANFWTGHHRLFEHVKTYSRRLMGLNMLWLLTIVFLPLPTEMLAVHGDEETLVRFVYIASVLASSLAITAVGLLIDRTPALRADPDTAPPPWQLRLLMPALVTVALVVAVAVPAIGMWAMLILFLTGPISRRLVTPRTAAWPDR
jgi:uncharacterized membrane protein